MKKDKFINKYLERLAKTIDNALDNNKEYILKKFEKKGTVTFFILLVANKKQI